MKRFLSIALSLVLLLCLTSPAFTPVALAAPEIVMSAAAYAPIIDGIVSPEEWGEKACSIDPFVTSSEQPTVARSGNGSKRPDRIDYWFRYDARFIYIAVRVTTDYFTYSDGDFRDGTYLVPRVDTDGDGVANYLGLIAVESSGEVTNRDNLLSAMTPHNVGAHVTDSGVEYEIAYSRYNCTFLDGTLDIDLDYYTPGDGIIGFRDTVTVSNEAPIPPDPSYGEPLDVLPLTSTVTLDGKAGAGEWGEPALSLSKKFTGGGRNYCCDYLNGQGLGIPDTDFYLRYDDTWFYAAVRIGKSAHTGTSTFSWDDKLVLFAGTKTYVIYLENKQARSVHIPKKDLAFRREGDVSFYEFRIPLSDLDVGAGDAFTGFLEYSNVQIMTGENGYSQFHTVTTRSVNSFQVGGMPINSFTLKTN